MRARKEERGPHPQPLSGQAHRPAPTVTGLTVALTFEELLLAGVLGVIRRVRGLRLPKINELESNFEMDILGAAAEMAVAKALDKFFPNDFKTDVGECYEVRFTPRPDGSLIVRQNDSDAKIYVLVTGGPTRFTIVGKIYGRDAKKDSYWRAPNGRPGAYFVPQSALQGFP